MRRVILAVIGIVLCVGLVGCGSTSDGVGSSGGSKLDQQVASVASVTILTAATNHSVTLTDATTIQRIIEAIKETKYSPGQLDIAGSDYTVTFEVKDGTKRVYSWWLGEKYTGLMTVTDQVGHYKLPDATKQDLLKLFSSN